MGKVVKTWAIVSFFLPALSLTTLFTTGCSETPNLFHSVPLTSKYFKMWSQDTISGFSDEVEADPTLLDEFNSLDFTSQNGIKYLKLVKNANFKREVLEGWDVIQINFGNIEVLNDTSFNTGYETFAEYDLSSLQYLDFGTSKWANEQTRGSLNATFKGCDLSNLISLNMKNIVCSVENADIAFNHLHTAFCTFNEAILTNLTSLDLSGARFISDNVAVHESVGVNKGIFVADGTFLGIDAPKLKNIDLTNTIFAAKNLGAGNLLDVPIYTACQTFASSKLPELEKIIFKNTIFAVEEMNEEALPIYTMSGTFANIEFDSLARINLSGAILVAEHMGQVEAWSASGAFAGSTFPLITELDLSQTYFAASEMSSYGNVYTAHQTFMNATFPNLTTLNLKNKDTFWATNMTSHTIYSASHTFDGFIIDESKLEEILLPDDYVGTGWDNTFSSHTVLDNKVTIYSSTTCPTWFNNNWWLNANWRAYPTSEQ